MRKPLRINTLTFQCCVLESELPVLLVFGAIWDPRSARFFSQLEYAARKYEGKIVFGRVEYDYNQTIYHDCGIEDLPALVFFENGKILKKLVGKSLTGTVSNFVDWYYGIYPYY